MKELNYIFYNSQDLYFKHPFGAVKCGDVVTFRLKIYIRYSENNIDRNIIEKVELVSSINNKEIYYNMDIENTINNEIIYKYTFKGADVSNIMFYYFKVNVKGKTIYYGNNKLCLGGVGETYENNPIPYQLTIYSKDLETPNWFKHSIIYQIFVDRFYNGNEEQAILNPKKNSFIYGNWQDEPYYIKDENGKIVRWEFYGGNLKGIIEKLDYLKSLGVNMLYLNPIFESRSNHKYDAGNYKNIDPMFGNDEIFKTLIEKAKERGIYIILDGVFSHTGSDSLYFNKYNTYNSVGAYQSKDSPYYDWYNFKNYPDKYECWWGVEDLPNVNELNESYLDYMILGKDSVINHWMDFGIKGWRLDVADELPDEFIIKLKNACIEKDKESVVIGEVWEDASNKISYGKRRRYFIDKELDSVTNYIFRDNLLKFLSGKINANVLQKRFMSMYENYPIHNFYSLINLIGSHDVERIYTMLKEITKWYLDNEKKLNYNINNNVNSLKHEDVTSLKNEDLTSLKNENELINKLAFKYLRLITLIQYTFPGVPLLYYGDEVGLEGFKDPFNRKTYPWGEENVEILEWNKKIINIRNKYPVLKTGDWKPLYFNEDVYGYVRSIKNNRDVFNVEQENCDILVIINRSITKEYNMVIQLEEGTEGVKLTDILANNPCIEIKEVYQKIKLRQIEGNIYEIKNIKKILNFFVEMC